MTIIKDGTGRGYAAGVDELGRIQANTVIVAHEQHHAVEYQNLFYATYGLTTADTNEAPLLFFQNDHTGREYEIYDVCVSADAAVIVRVYANSVYTSGGTEVVPVNMNLGSGQLPIVNSYEGGASDNLSITTSDLLKAFHLPSNTAYGVGFKGSLIIPKGKGISVTAQGAGATEVLGTINFAHNPPGRTG